MRVCSSCFAEGIDEDICPFCGQVVAQQSMPSIISLKANQERKPLDTKDGVHPKEKDDKKNEDSFMEGINFGANEATEEMEMDKQCKPKSESIANKNSRKIKLTREPGRCQNFSAGRSNFSKNLHLPIIRVGLILQRECLIESIHNNSD